MKKQPGILFYFNIRPCLSRLSTEEKGLLFEAMLDYGEEDLLPQFEGALGVAWDFILPMLEHDRLRYSEKVEKARQAAMKRWEMQMHTDACQRMPNTNPNTNTKTNSSSNSNTNTTTTAEPDFNHRRNEGLRLLDSYQNRPREALSGSVGTTGP